MSLQVVIELPSGKPYQTSLKRALRLQRDGIVTRLSDRLFRQTPPTGDLFRQSLRFESGRRMEGVSRPKFNGKYSTSSPNRRVKPAEEIRQDDLEKVRYLEVRNCAVPSL